MSVLDRKLLREFSASRGLLLAITSIIAVGVACYVALGTAHENLNVAKKRYYRETRLADFSIELKRMPTAELFLVAKLPGVTELRSRIQFGVTVDLPNVIKPLNGQVVSLPDERRPVINDIVLKRGSYFSNRRDNEVIVADAFAKAHELKPGDWIHLLLNNRRQEMLIVGTAISSEFTYMVAPGSLAPDPKSFGVFYIKQTFAEETFDFAGATNQILGLLAPTLRDRPQETLRQAEELLEAYGVLGTTPRELQASNRYLTNEIEQLETFSGFMPAVFLTVAAIVLNVLLSRLAEQQRVEIGTLKALGYTNRQVLMQFVKFGTTVGLFGGLVGCALGYWMAGGMTNIYRQFFEFPTLSNEFYPSTQAIGLTISLLCGLVGSLRGAWHVVQLRPAEAMRPAAPRAGGAIALEQLGALWRHITFAWRMVLRSIFRRRFRSLAGIFAPAMGATILVSSFMMIEASDFMLDFQFRLVRRSDVDLALKDQRGPDALLEAQRLPGVRSAEPVFDLPCTFSNGNHEHKGGISGIVRNAQLTTPRDRHGRRVHIPATGLVMERNLAEKLHLAPGDVVRVKPSIGLRREHRLPVVALADGYFGYSVYANFDYLCGLEEESAVMNSIQLASDQPNGNRVELYRRLKQLPALQAVHAKQDTLDNLVNTLQQNQDVMIFIIVGFAGVIFFGSVLNSSLVSLTERSREVATLHVLGYTPWQIGNLLLRESLMLTAIGTLFGLPLGYLLTTAAAASVETELFRLPVVTAPWIWAWTAVLALSFTLAAHAIVQRTILRLDWRDSLNTRE